MTWTLPTTLPDLSRYDRLALDIETRDPDLTTKGLSIWRGGGKIVGIAVAAPDGKRWYLPFGHEEGTQFTRAEVVAWAQRELARPNQPKVLANAKFDILWLRSYGIDVSGPWLDVQVAEPLLDENRGTYKLDSLAQAYLGEGKDEALLAAACEERGWKGKPQEHLWRLPPELVAPYAEADVDRTLRVFDYQRKALARAGMTALFDLETRVLEVLVAMQERGVHVDVAGAERLRAGAADDLQRAQENLDGAAGRHVDAWAAASIAEALDGRGLVPPRTGKTAAPAFRHGWLAAQDDEVCRGVLEVRRLSKFLTTFVEGMVLGATAGGRVHPWFNALRGDDFGAVTGRFSCDSPNLQQIPKRDQELGPAIRGLFLPEEGELWGRADYSSIEIRILAHYAVGPGAEDVRAAFHANPRLDYHQLTADAARCDRQLAKIVNFAAVYGAGAAKIGAQLGLPLEEAKRFLAKYHAALPFIKATMAHASDVAAARGDVKTILGRRRRFDQWEPSDFELSQEFRHVEDVDRKDRAAVAAWAAARAQELGRGSYRRGTKRAWTYRALNAVIQGSAADLMKQAMVDIWGSGVCRVLGAPLLTIHDELAFSVPDTVEGREAFAEMVRLMERAIEFRVPVLAEASLGATWGG